MKNNDDSYPDDELIEAYLLGLLPEADRLTLEKRMADDPEVAEKVALHRKVEQTLRFARKLRLREQFYVHFDKRAKTETPEHVMPVRVTSKTMNIRRWALAAVFLMLYGAIAFFAGTQIGKERVRETGHVAGDTTRTKKNRFDTEKSDSIPSVPPDPTERQKRIFAGIIFKQRGVRGEVLKGSNLPSSDTLILQIENFWKNGQYKDVIRLAPVYLKNHESASILELYADAAFKEKKYAEAEAAYLKLAKEVLEEEKPLWNALVCRALQWPLKTKEFENLADEIDGWAKPNLYQNDLIQLRDWIKELEGMKNPRDKSKPAN